MSDPTQENASTLVYEVHCSYPVKREATHGGKPFYMANARYHVLAPDLDAAIARVRDEWDDCEIHQVIKRSHGVKVLIA